MSRVGEKILNLRVKAGMTQKVLGKKLGVSESYINDIETGRKVASQSMIDKISKLLGKNIDDMVISFEEEVLEESSSRPKTNSSMDDIKNKKINDVWVDALGSVLKTIPIYKYNLKDIIGKKELPLKSNRIEGYAPDKVFFIEIENDDMIGFRIAKGDLAFCHVTHEVEHNAICLVEYGKGPVVRQVKRLDASKVLLLSNKGSLVTETIETKNVRVLAKLDKLEIKL